MVEGSWELRDAGGNMIDESNGRVGDARGNQTRGSFRLRDLLADTVESGDVDPPRSFTLKFVSGLRLTIFDDSDMYESFTLLPEHMVV
jgi:hypothetical protein